MVIFSLSARTTEESFTSFSAMIPYIISPIKRATACENGEKFSTEKVG
jgi:hypothetical protein